MSKILKRIGQSWISLITSLAIIFSVAGSSDAYLIRSLKLMYSSFSTLIHII